MRIKRFLFIACLPFIARLGAATPSLTFHFDHFGWRTGDQKRLVMTSNPGATVEIKNFGTGLVAFTVPTDGGSITSLGLDPNAGQNVWRVDFSAFSAPGTYFFNCPGLGIQSYIFEIRDDIYNAPGVTALKAFYYQRCNTPKLAAYAGNWADNSACHMADQFATNTGGHTNYGTRDLTGGWHDAGDYNKYGWYAAADSTYQVLQAWEDNMAAFGDSQTNIPESGNGVPDVLDEMKWELDWLLKMQLPSGAFSDRLNTAGFTWNSPPSADVTLRYYRDPTPESNGIGTGSLARAARAFAVAGLAGQAAIYKAAALQGWTYLNGFSTTDETKAWAAAEIFAMDPTVLTARNYVDSLGWSFYFDPDHWNTWAATTYAQAPGATLGTVNAMRTSIGNRVNSMFTNAERYEVGMDNWQYYWGSNRPRAKYGVFLALAAKMGATGSYTAAQCRTQALNYLHYFHGLNAKNMVYLSNMASIGGEHSCFQIYHGWFGASGIPFSATNFIGKPGLTIEPNYPYYAGTDNLGVNDNKISAYGPAPGILPGGVNTSYSGTAIPPKNSIYKDQFYRDWCDQGGLNVKTWEITEPSLSSQGPYVALAAYFMGAVPTPTPSPTISATRTQTPDWTATITPTPARSWPKEAGPRVYPNPVNLSDPSPANRVIRVDFAEPGSQMKVYNMVGEGVYSVALKGDPMQDVWDVVNNNGVTLVTGIYLVVITQPTRKSSVQRIAVLQ